MDNTGVRVDYEVCNSIQMLTYSFVQLRRFSESQCFFACYFRFFSVTLIVKSALINAGFGKFHFFLLTVCGMIYMNTAIGITIISFVLPSATCDFQMSSSDKGLLTAAPMLGRLLNAIKFNYWLSQLK